MIDLFCGAGGLSLGLEAAGFRSEVAIDFDGDCCQTYSGLFPYANLINGSIEAIDFRRYAGQIELVAGGPPCQPFSNGGKRLATKDTRNMIPQFIRVIREVKPPLFLMENVSGLASGDRKDYLEAVIKEFSTLGYKITWQIVNAADYGVPQKRIRLIVIGSKLGVFEFPKPTHGPDGTVQHVAAGKVLSKQAIGEKNMSKVIYAKNPDLRPSPYDGHLFNGGGRPINLEVPCPTILASAGGNKTHFIDTLNEVPRYHAELTQGKPPRVGTLPGGRRLTVEESALIQTFPVGTHFYGSRSSQYTQVGNAVPPRLAEVIGQELAIFLGVTNGKVSVV